MLGPAGVDQLISEWQWALQYHTFMLAKARGKKQKRVQREEINKCRQILIVLEAVRGG